MQANKDLRCRIFGHHRSRVRAFQVGGSGLWRSYCSRCGAPMRKEYDGKWIEREPEPENPVPAAFRGSHLRLEEYCFIGARERPSQGKGA